MKIVVIWARFGPYHLARLKAAGRRFASEGLRVVGLEVARNDNTYAWRVTEGAEAFERMTVCSNNYDALSPRYIKRAVIEALDQIDPIAVATAGWSPPEATGGLHWCRQNGRAAVVMSESKQDDMPRFWWKELVKRLVVRRFDAALVGGAPHAQYVKALGISPDRVFMGYDVVDNDYFGDASRAARADEVRLRRSLNLPQRFFLCVGRFVAKKNLRRLLKAYATYRDACRTPWGLVLCGDGELGSELREFAMQLGSEGVIWPGFAQVDELPRFYGLASAFVLPSTTEQWGLVVNEAMASGLPVLVSNTAGCRYDLVEDGINGLLFDPFDEHDIARAMLKMTARSDAEQDAMSSASRRIIARWGPERFADGLWQATCVSSAKFHSRGLP